RGGVFKANYYGSQEGEFYENINIETKIKTINDSQFIIFLGMDYTYAILLKEFKGNLKRIWNKR
ncbi:Erp family outer-surface lipoprotein, partial [Borreliella spielmanii]